MTANRRRLASGPIQLEMKFPPPPKATELLSIDELYDGMDKALLDKLKEDSRAERKRVNVHSKQLGDYFSMWANTAPEGGLLLIGVENDGEIAGCRNASQNQINEIERSGNVHCPDARFRVKRINVQNCLGEDDFVIVFRVLYRADKVVKTVHGEAFIRTGDTKRKLLDEEIRELEIEKGQIDFEQEPSGFVYPDDFNKDLIREYVNAFISNRQIDTKHSIEDILSLSHMGKVDSGKFIPNNACALLFSNDPRVKFPGCKIRFLRFDGDDEGTGERFNVTKDIMIDEGAIPNQIVSFEKIMDNQVREFSKLGKDGIFYSAPEYPKPAWYEAVVNACVHRSYSLRTMNIFVKMFDNRLVIESPGGFPAPVTPENIYEMHVPRNPYLMQAMYYLKFVKCAHEGTRRIRDTMALLDLPRPEFTQEEVRFALVRVTLRNNISIRKVFVDRDVSAVIGTTLARTLTENELRIINFLAEHKQISVSQVQRLTGKSWPASSKLLKGLKKKGILNDIRTKKLRDPAARYLLAVVDEKEKNIK